MARKGYSDEECSRILRQIEVELSGGADVATAGRSAGKLFVDAAELGSLSKVASAYGTSQPHISRQISVLEQECGGQFF